MIRRYVLNWLINAIDIPDAPKPDETTKNLLGGLWLNEHLRRYLFSRESKLQEYLALTAVALADADKPDRESHAKQYALAKGQLFELRVFCHHMESCYKKLSTGRTHSST